MVSHTSQPEGYRAYSEEGKARSLKRETTVACTLVEMRRLIREKALVAQTHWDQNLDLEKKVRMPG